MIDEHLLACRNIKFLIDQRLGHMPRELRVSFKARERLQAPAFIGVFVSVCASQRESRHLIKKEIQTVIVINDDRDIWIDVFESFFYRLIAIKKTLPVRRLFLFIRHRITDSRYMRSRNTADDSSHSSNLVP